MTQELSFKYYIENYNNIEVYNFKECFKDKIDLLPSKTISSKKITEILKISNDLERLIFRSVFLKYFKEKLFRDI